MKIRTREELLEKLADTSMELDELREKLRKAQDDATYWFQRCKEQEARADVPGVSHASAPAGVSECAGAGTSEVPELR